LTTTYLAFTGTVVLAPAMNTNMWNHAATQANIEVLRGRGHVVVEPDEGLLACGMTVLCLQMLLQIIIPLTGAARR